MKKFITLSFVVFLLIIGCMIVIPVGEALAEDCSRLTSGCQWSDWQADTQLQGFIEVDLPGGCKIWVQYIIRTVSCPPITVHEISITSIEKNGCAISDPEVFQNAVKAVLFASSTIFGSGGTMNVRVKMPACYRWSGNSVTWGPSANICSCCSYLYNLTTYSNYININSVSQDPYDPDPPCPTNPTGLSCYEYSSCAISGIPTGPVTFPSVYPACPDVSCPGAWDVDPQHLAYTGKLGPDPNPCIFTIYYQKKLCPNTDQKLRIVKIVCNGNCGTYTPDIIYKKAVKRLLSEAGEIFNNYTTQIVHFNTTKCWKSGTVGSYTIYSPCDINNCCEWDYSINNGVTPHQLTYVNPGANLDTCAVGCDVIQPCWNGLLNLPVGDLPGEDNRLPKQPSLDNGEQKVLEQNLNTSFVIPNPAGDKLDIYLQSSDKGSTTIIVSDSRGEEIIKLEFEKTSFESVTRIETRKFLSGMYNYRILMNGKITAKGKFVISH